MKFRFAWLPLLCAVVAQPVQAVVLNGRDYTPLAGWAAANQFHETPDGSRERCTLTPDEVYLKVEDEGSQGPNDDEPNRN